MVAETVLLAIVWGVAGAMAVALGMLYVSIKHSNAIIEKYKRQDYGASELPDAPTSQPWQEEGFSRSGSTARAASPEPWKPMDVDPFGSPDGPAWLTMGQDEPPVLSRKVSVRQFASAIDRNSMELQDMQGQQQAAAKREERLEQERREQAAEREQQRLREERDLLAAAEAEARAAEAEAAEASLRRQQSDAAEAEAARQKEAEAAAAQEVLRRQQEENAARRAASIRVKQQQAQVEAEAEARRKAREEEERARKEKEKEEERRRKEAQEAAERAEAERRASAASAAAKAMSSGLAPVEEEDETPVEEDEADRKARLAQVETAVAKELREKAEQLRQAVERKKRRQEAELWQRQQHEQATVASSLAQLQSAEEALRRAESSNSAEVQRLRDEVTRLKALVDLAMKEEERARQAHEAALKTHADAQHEADLTMAAIFKQEEELELEAEALAREESEVAQRHDERQQRLAELRAQEKQRAQEKAAQDKKQLERRLRREQEELRAKQSTNLLANSVHEDGKELHLKSKQADEVILASESWYQPSWTKTEALEYLQDTEKGAFVVRQTKADFAISLQCGPKVQNRLAHVRLQKWRRHDGTVFFNVAPTEHYFESLYDLVLYCHQRPFVFQSMDPKNEISLSLNAVQHAEEKKQKELDEQARKLERDRLAEMERIEAEERERLAELEKQHAELEERTQAALEAKKRALRSIRRKHSKKIEDGQNRRRASQALVASTQKSVLEAEAKLKKATAERERLEQELRAAEQALRDALDRKSETEREAELLAERKRKELEREREGIKVTLTESTLEVNDVINFGSNNSVINPESYPVLDAVAQAIIDAGEILIEVAGHTAGGGRNPARNVAYRKALSQDRANSVANYLKKKGVRAEYLITAGYGDTRPVATNDTQDGRDLNRRVEFIVHAI